MKPKYKHDCNGCVFLGHFVGYDVYMCNTCLESDWSATLLARHGDDPAAYGSTPLKLFQDSIADPEHRIGGSNMPTMVYAEYLFSEYLLPHHKAWILALLTSYPTKGYPPKE